MREPLRHARVPKRVPFSLSTLPFFLIVLAAYCVAMYAMWGVILRLFPGESLQDAYKNFYPDDQYTYLAVSQNVAAGIPSTVEPLTATGNSLYPSAYYVLLGLVAKLTSTTVFFAWNVVGMIFTLALALSVGAVGTWLSRSRWGWLIGPLPFLVGTFQWYSDGGWVSHVGTSHAVIWPPMAILFTPGAETAALAYAALTLLGVLRALYSPRHRYLILAGAGSLAGLILLTHTYVGLLVALLTAIVMLVHALSNSNKREAIVSSVIVLIAFAAAAGPFLDMQLARYVTLMVGFVAPLILIGRSRRRWLGIVIAFFCPTVLVFLPLALRIVKDLRSPNSFFSFRQANAAQIDLGMPVVDALVGIAPALLPAAFALAMLWKATDERQRLWRTAIIAALVASALMMFNNSWGLSQEPYRFFPYAFTLLLMLGVPALFLGHGRRVELMRVAVVAALVNTTPTTLAFQMDVWDNALLVHKPERDAVLAVAEHTDNAQITLVDSCLNARVIAVISNINVTEYNLGLGIPLRKNAIDTVNIQVLNKSTPTEARLRSAGIGQLLTKSSCANARVWADTFGAPIFQGPSAMREPGALSPTAVPGEHYLVFGVTHKTLP